MKAAVWYGGKDFRIEEVPRPAVGSHEILIRVKAAGICGSELHAYEGLSRRRRPPLVMGHEFAGIVEEVGESSKGVKAGDRIVVNPAVSCGLCENCMRGKTIFCTARTHVGIDFPGAFAEYVKVPDRACYTIPDGLPFEMAALAEPLSMGTHAVSVVDVKEEDSVFIIGSGMIGLSCLLAARERSGKIFVTDLYDARLDFSRLLGADQVIHAAVVDPVREVQRLTSGKGASVVMEAVGIQKTMIQALSAAGEGGRVAILGLLDAPVPVSFLEIVLKHIQLNGIYGRTDHDFRRALTLLEKDLSKIRRLITGVLPLDRVSEAFETMSSQKQSTMKIILVPSP